MGTLRPPAGDHPRDVVRLCAVCRKQTLHAFMGSQIVTPDVLALEGPALSEAYSMTCTLCGNTSTVPGPRRPDLTHDALWRSELRDDADRDTVPAPPPDAEDGA